MPKASPRHLGLLHRHSVPRSPQPRPSPLEGLSAAPVHLKAAGAEGGVQEHCAVDLGAPGHVEDPYAGKAAVSRAPFPTARPRDFQGPEPQPPALPWGQLQSQVSARQGLTCHTGVHQGHTGTCAECPEHNLGEVAPPLGGHGSCKGTEELRARTPQASLPRLCTSGCLC